METINLRLEKRTRAGKMVTVLGGFTRRADEMIMLAQKIKIACGTGGTVKDGRIIIQGDFRKQISGILQKLGFQVKG